MSDTAGPIFKALAAARAKFAPIAKSAINPHFKSKYATLEDYISATVPALSANGLAVIQRVEVDAAGNVVLRTLLGHESGQLEVGVYPVMPVQASPQGYGSALSYARRYSYAAALNLAAEDDDGNASSEPASHPTERRETATYGGAPPCPKCGGYGRASKYDKGPRYYCPSEGCKEQKGGKLTFYGFDVREPGVDEGAEAFS